MRVLRSLFPLLLVAVVAAAQVPPGLMAREVATHPAWESDTLVVTTTWQLGNASQLDSLRVQIRGLPGPPSRTYRSPIPLTDTQRIPLPVEEGGSTSTWSVRSCVGVWRRGAYAETCSPAEEVTTTPEAPVAPMQVLMTLTRIPG